MSDQGWHRQLEKCFCTGPAATCFVCQASDVTKRLHNSALDECEAEADKAPPTHYRAARAYMQILGLLSKHRWISAGEVQARLKEAGWEYGKRAVEKMLKSLADEHPAVVRDDSVKPFLYSWSTDQDNPWNPELSDRESLTLLLAGEHLRQLLPTEVQHWMDGRFREAKRRMDPARGVQPFNSWPQKVAVVSLLPAMLPPKISPEVYANVSQALLSDRWLNVDYRNANGKLIQDRRIMPLALVQQAERLFLVCRFGDYQDVRHLALHRMLSAQATPHEFERPKDFSLQHHISSGRFGFGNGEFMQLKLRVQRHIADLLVETPLSTDQEIFPEGGDDGQSIVIATVPRSEQMRWWIRMQGRAVAVVEPFSLFDELNAIEPPRTPPVVAS